MSKQTELRQDTEARRMVMDAIRQSSKSQQQAHDDADDGVPAPDEHGYWTRTLVGGLYYHPYDVTTDEDDTSDDEARQVTEPNRQRGA